METSFNNIISFIWGIADDVLRDVFLRGQYRDVILPMVVLRRLDVLLEGTKDKVDSELKEEKEMGMTSIDEDAIKDITGLSYFNTSKWTLQRIKATASDDNNLLYDNFAEYLNGYSDNVKDVLKNFDYFQKARKLADNNRLLSIINKITDPHINLSNIPTKDPDGLPLPAIDNHTMGTIFEELLRRFNEENNEEAGEHFTPRDAIGLLARLLFEPVKDNLPKVITLRDPAAGSGGMLTEGRQYLISELGVQPNAIMLYGTEINPETYAICKADLIIKGVDPKGMYRGNTITDDHFAGQNFGYQMTNPPYGKSWGEDAKIVYDGKVLLDNRYELELTNFKGEEETLACTPRTSDGQLLFMLEMIDKMKLLAMQPQGSRIASIHNGSALFTGEANSGESRIRRYIVENDMLEAIIQLPDNIFYNTGITTYIWILTNKKQENRKGKVQLIDASNAYEKLRKNLGKRNCTLLSYTDRIVKVYMDFADREADNDNPVRSKIFDNDDFRYYNVTIQRPLRLRSQFTKEKVDELLFDTTDTDLEKKLYEVYQNEVFLGLNSHKEEINKHLTDNGTPVTIKKLNNLISADKWNARKELKEFAEKIMAIVGTDVSMDYNAFREEVEKAAKSIDNKVKSTTIDTIAKAMSETCPEAKPVIKKIHKANSKDINELEDVFGVPEGKLMDYGFYKQEKGKYIQYESDGDLKDAEKIPFKEDIYEYFLREVRPYVDDAWIELPSTIIGCEISFNKYFYQPKPLRSLEENTNDIIALSKESEGFIDSLLKEEEA